MAIGNLKYASPELIKGIGDVDGRSDLYSLGMVLYEMLCGRPAFVMESEFELMAAHVGAPPAPPDAVNPQVPRAFDSVLLKALAKNPADRYQTAAEFDVALYEAGEAACVEPPAAPPAMERPALPPEAPNRAPIPPAAPPPVAQQPAAVAPPAMPTEPAPPTPFLSAPEAPMLSRRQIMIASAAGAFTGVLLAVVWLFVR